MDQVKNKNIFSSIGKNIVRIFVKVLSDFFEKKSRSALLLVLAFLIFWNLGFVASLNWIVFLAFLFYGWENKILGIGALIFLSVCFTLLFFQQDAFAEIAATQAYFLIVMTVVLQIVDFKKEKKIAYQEDVNRVEEVFKSSHIKKEDGEWVFEGAVEILSEEEKRMKRKKMMYILLISFLFLEIAVVFFNWSLIVIVFWIICAIAVIFPKNVIKFLFSTSIFFCILAVISIIFSQKDLATASYFGILFVFAFIAVIVSLRVFGRKAPNSPRKWVRSFSYLHKNKKSDE
ncbi:MAG: hypothetical protein WC819_01010 [Parcubacteria group bacterium]|jgi:MFS family permease